MIKKIFLFVFLSLFGHTFAQTEGFAKNEDSSQTYYKIFGKGTPILIINGGPGMNSNGFEPIAKFWQRSIKPLFMTKEEQENQP